MKRYYASLFASVIAGMAATDAGLPFWRQSPPGDAFDFMLCTALAVWYGLGAIAQADTRRMAETALAGSGRSPRGTVGAEGDDAPTPSNPLHPKE